MKKCVLVLFFLACGVSAKMVDVTIKSKLMNQEFGVRIITPTQYDGKKALAQVYLLHGAGDDSKAWFDKTGLLQKFADKYKRIIVCPTAGKYSWYNSFNKSEDYIIKEVLPYVDQTYKTKNDRWIVGNSMGGYGAVRLGHRYPKLFSAWCGLSAGVMPSHWVKKWRINKEMGPEAKTGKQDLFTPAMIEQLKNDKRPKALVWGNKDFFRKDNAKALKRMQDAKIKVLNYPTKGGHNWIFWKKEIEKVLDYFAK